MNDDLLKRLLRLHKPPKTLRERVALTPILPPLGFRAPLPQLKPLLPPPKRVSKPRSLTAPMDLNLSRFRVRAAIRKAVGGEITRGIILPDPDTLGLTDGRRLSVAILYADLRGFSTMVVTSPKRSALVILQAFVSEMTRITSTYHGDVVDCAGDRILAAFPQRLLDRTTRTIHNAVTCALWMQTVMARVIVPELSSRGYPGLSCGIGVDYGPVVVARVGIRNRNRLVFLGPPAVIAAKLEEAAEPGETLMSQTVYRNRPQYLSEANNWIIRARPERSPECYSTTHIFADEVAPQAV